jgi:probable HAF family extracellular repeat protein
MRLSTLCSIPILGILLLVGQLAVAADDATYTLTTVDVPFPGASATFLRGIARHGLVVGIYRDENDEGHGFLYADGNFVPLDVPGGFSTFPQGVNDRGDVVGSYNPEQRSNRHGFIYSGGVFRTLDFPGPPPATELHAINNRGEVVGIYYGTGDGLIHSFVYTDNVFMPLAVPGARLTVAFGINDHGEIVGWYQDFSFRPHGFIYARGEFTTLNVPGAVSTLALGINNQGQIAGLFDTPEPSPPPIGSAHNYRHGLVYAKGAFTRLDVLGAAFTEAWGLNEAGIVVGDYFDSDGWHGFIATPSAK